MSSLALSSGFADPVLDGQATFHAAMNALARPGSIEAIGADLDPPMPLTAELAAIALALVDHETTLWLDGPLGASSAVVDYLRFHTGVKIVAEPADAAFALVVDVADMPRLSEFSLGSDEYPDRSTTIVIAVERLAAGAGSTLSGPGIDHISRLIIEPRPSDMAGQLAANRALFPRGVDLIFAAPGAIAALPRTTKVSEG